MNTLRPEVVIFKLFVLLSKANITITIAQAWVIKCPFIDLYELYRIEYTKRFHLLDSYVMLWDVMICYVIFDLS